MDINTVAAKDHEKSMDRLYTKMAKLEAQVRDNRNSRTDSSNFRATKFPKPKREDRSPAQPFKFRDKSKAYNSYLARYNANANTYDTSDNTPRQNPSHKSQQTQRIRFGLSNKS